MPAVDIPQVTEEAIAVEEGATQKEFSIVRKGYDPAEVQEHLAEYDVALRELEEYATRLKHELAEAKVEISRLQAAEQDSVDKAMLAVFDAKERIMERARLKAQEIEEEARVAAGLPPSDDLDASLPLEDSEPAIDEEELPAVGAVHFSPESQKRPEPQRQPVSQQEDLAELVAGVDVGSELLAELKAVDEDTDGPAADDILRQMVSEADTIKAQLEAGMSAALEEMERMQHEAETRAADLLDEARKEAIRLRSAGADSKLVGTTLEVTLAEGSGEEEKRSRYSKTSAKLPRLGSDDGPSVLASMNQLRNKLREAEAAERQAQPESTAS